MVIILMIGDLIMIMIDYTVIDDETQYIDHSQRGRSSGRDRGLRG
jgi:hypothetical protein